jgi:integrase
MKMNKDVTVPINREARAAIEKQLARERPNSWLFASPMKQETHLNTGIARQWWYKAEELAELKHVPGGAWHMARRGFVMERKDANPKVVAALGGWDNERVMQSIYTQTTFEDMVSIITKEDNNGEA